MRLAVEVRRHWTELIGHGLLLSLIFTLYLAPDEAKYVVADVLVVAWLGVWGLSGRVGGRVLLDAFKPLLPLLALLAYAQAFDVGRGVWESRDYTQTVLISIPPFFLMYLLFQGLSPRRAALLSVGVLILPGLVHLGYMYVDILRAVSDGHVPFLTSSKHGLLEYIKDTPRVGRRYVSLALVHLLFGSGLLAVMLRGVEARYWAWGLSGVCLISLALLDARAAYFSLIVGAALLFVVTGPVGGARVLRQLVASGRPWWRLATVGVLMVVAVLGYSAGKSRWTALTYSVNAAVHDVSETAVPPVQRAYVSTTFWSAPIGDVAQCYADELFRCKSDQSAYLRFSWLLEGLRSLLVHPAGIGMSGDYMGRLWGVAGQRNTYQRTDSFTVELMVSFGFVGVFLFACLWWRVGKTLRDAISSEHVNRAALVAVGGLLFVCVGRGVVDMISDGLWRYVLALLGMYYGLLNSGVDRIKEG
ncbi:MAG: hypothetical protein KDF24_11890 [Rhodocyclaceae bacterium]|nr:hypothetical protein [Rhodocyclaceae bacterium]